MTGTPGHSACSPQGTTGSLCAASCTRGSSPRATRPGTCSGDDQTEAFDLAGDADDGGQDADRSQPVDDRQPEQPAVRHRRGDHRCSQSMPRRISLASRKQHGWYRSSPATSRRRSAWPARGAARTHTIRPARTGLESFPVATATPTGPPAPPACLAGNGPPPRCRLATCRRCPRPCRLLRGADWTACVVITTSVEYGGIRIILPGLRASRKPRATLKQ